MPKKVYNLPLDLNRRTCSKKIVVRRNDYDTTVFAVQVFLNGIPYDITGLKPVFECIKPDGNRFRDDGSLGNFSIDENYFYVSKWASDNYRENDFSMPSINLKLEPNTQYTVSTNVPLNSNGYDDVFAYNTDYRPSTPDNGVASGHPRTITTDSTGVLVISCRAPNSPGSITNGTYWIKVQKGTEATAYSPVSGAMKGKFEYTLPNELLMAQGEIPSAYFVLEKSDQALQNATDRMSTGDIPFTVIPDAVSLFPRNYFVLKKSVTGYIADDGQLTGNSTIITSDYLWIGLPFTCTLRGGHSDKNFIRVAFFDSSKTFITRSIGPNVGRGQDMARTITTVPDGTALIRLSVERSDSIMLEQGAISHPFVPAPEDL